MDILKQIVREALEELLSEGSLSLQKTVRKLQSKKIEPEEKKKLLSKRGKSYEQRKKRQKEYDDHIKELGHMEDERNYRTTQPWD